MSEPMEAPGPGPDVRISPDLETLSRAAAGAVVRVAHETVAARGRFTISLAGGSTPRRLYELLAGEHRDAMPWDATHVYFGDERCVPPVDAASNYRMAHDVMLSRVPIPAEQVHRIRGELPPEEAAREYGRFLRRVFDRADEVRTGGSADRATFDVALLGMGVDGHTASLFPGSPALDERHHWVVAVEAPPYVPPPRTRVTLTLPALRGARAVFVLAAGAEKRPVVEAVLGDETRARSARVPLPLPTYPVARVTGAERTTWFLDRTAAGRIGSTARPANG